MSTFNSISKVTPINDSCINVFSVDSTLQSKQNAEIQKHKTPKLVGPSYAHSPMPGRFFSSLLLFAASLGPVAPASCFAAAARFCNPPVACSLQCYVHVLFSLFSFFLLVSCFILIQIFQMPK